MFVFGTQYLRGSTPSEDQWDADMAQMKRYGFNTIRAWLVWNALEREEGIIDTPYIARFLQCAKKHGLQVGLLFHLHACPVWTMEKYPQYFYVDSNGQPFEPAVRPNTPGGGWPGLCFDHEEVRILERRFIEGVMAETRKHDNVAFYEPMNEPHQWIDFKKDPAGFFCYCSASVSRFQAWLERKYGTIEKLNEAWGHFYTRFSQVRPPRWTNAYGPYMDFRLFTMENVVEEIRYRTQIIKANDTKPVVAHSWGGGAVTCANLGGMAFDDWKNAEIFDKWGYSAFPNRAEDCCSLGLGCAATRCAANGKEYWQSELTAGLVGTGLEQQGRIDDHTFDKFSLESIRQGAKGLLYWQYRKERYGAEFGGFALTHYDGSETNLSRKAGLLCKAVTENEDIFCNAVPPKAEVALVFSIRSYLADWCSSNMASNKFCVDSISGYYRMLWEENITADILHEEYAGDLSRYKLIIVPSPFAISQELAQKLEYYIRQGGTVLSDPDFAVFDQETRLSYQVPGFGFNQVFGCRQDDLTTSKTVVLDDGTVLAGNKHKETYRNVTAQVLRRYADGSPAILKNHWGEGDALISGVNLGLTYSRRTLISDDILTEDAQNASEAAKCFVLDLCRRVGIAGNCCDVANVKVSVLHAENAAAVILINSGAAEAKGKVRLQMSYSRVQLIYGAAECRIQGAELSFTLEGDGGCILRLS